MEATAISLPTARREAAVLLTLAAIAIVSGAGVFALVNRFHQWRGSLSERLYEVGQGELQSGNPLRAVEDFRSALAFQNDNYQYQLSLGQALESAGLYDEAESYLRNLWERQPQDGMVNLQLARLAAHRRISNQTLRYYHNAIYGIWQQNPDQNRRVARLELIEYLIREGSPAQAQAETLAMAAALPPDPELIDRAAGLFMEIGDYENALDQYRHAYQLDRKNLAAAEGAGQAAFKLGRYKTAERYLEVAVNGGRTQAHDMLATAQLILSSDPFRSNLPAQERLHRTQNAYEAASNRLQKCMNSHGETSSDTGNPSVLQQLEQQRQELKPKLRATMRNPDLLDSIMSFVFDVEETAEQECGAPTGLDEALLLIGRNREGVER